MSHIPALRALPEYEIVAVANSSASSSQAAAKAFDIPHAHPDAAALASDPDVDLVAITVKVPQHKQLIDAALDAGKMVFCEWPLANGLAEAEGLAGRARQLGVRTAVGLQARSSPVIRYLRDLIREGYVGEVLSSTVVGSAYSQGAFVTAPNAYTNDRTSGATVLTMMFGHMVDALCWCLGEFREVSATMAMRRKTYTVIETQEQRPMNVDDQVIVGGVLKSGAVVSVHYRGGISRGTNLLWEINGTEGDLQVTSMAGYAETFDHQMFDLRGGRGKDTGLKVLEIPEKYRTVPAEVEGFAVNVGEAYARFAEGPGAQDPVPDFDAAVVRHRLLDAVERSANSGQRVTL
jgi:predicted dehydrogenase